MEGSVLFCSAFSAYLCDSAVREPQNSINRRVAKDRRATQRGKQSDAERKAERREESKTLPEMELNWTLHTSRGKLGKFFKFSGYRALAEFTAVEEDHLSKWR